MIEPIFAQWIQAAQGKALYGFDILLTSPQSVASVASKNIWLPGWLTSINSGTNLPSVATPNGQAAFLFLLTSSVAPLLGLSYLRMVLMALPYTIVLSIVGVLSVIYFL